VVLGVSAFFYPVWTGMQIPSWFWSAHNWLRSWI
jgi:dolichyl-phosphate-mannose-protein mannosyltransferase